MKSSTEHNELIAELERNRAQVSGDLAEFGESVNFSHRFQDSVREHPAWWIGGGVLGGIILSRLLIPQGRRGEEKGKSLKSSAFLGLLGFAAKEILRFSTPALKQAAGHQLEKWMTESRPQPAGDTETDSHPNQESR